MAAQAAVYAQSAAENLESAHGYGVNAAAAIAAASGSWAQGDRFFRVVLSDSISADVLGTIEAAGWQLTSASHVFIPRSTSGAGVNLIAGVGVVGATTQGIIVGVYLFRRPD